MKESVNGMKSYVGELCLYDGNEHFHFVSKELRCFHETFIGTNLLMHKLYVIEQRIFCETIFVLFYSHSTFSQVLRIILILCKNDKQLAILFIGFAHSFNFKFNEFTSMCNEGTQKTKITLTTDKQK